MASLRNAVPQRPYRERAQPQSRARHGLLEKHKDYSARARDYNEKKKRLRILRQKATDRNPDEFHFAMMSSRSRDGVKIADRGNTALSNDVVKLLKTQDAGYLRTMRGRAMKNRERLEQEVELLEDNGKGERSGMSQTNAHKHTVFVEDEDAQKTFSAEEWFQTSQDGAKRIYNRPRQLVESKSQDEAQGKADMTAPQRAKTQPQSSGEHQAWKDARSLEKKRLRNRAVKQARLDAVRTRENELLIAERELDVQRAKMNHSIGGVNKNGVKFKVRERKR